MNKEKGFSLIEVIWTILIISSIISSTIIYHFKYCKKVKSHILEKTLLIEYHQIVETFRKEYEKFETYLVKLNLENNVYYINVPYIKDKLYLILNYKKEVVKNKTKYTLKVVFPDKFKEEKFELFKETIEVIVV